MKYENFTVTQGTRRTISIFYLRGTLKKKYIPRVRQNVGGILDLTGYRVPTGT